MSKVVDSFTGEAERKAGKQSVKELSKGRDAVSRLSEQARGTLGQQFNLGQQARRAGLQGALDVFGSSIPMRAGLAQEGNVAAQQALLSGLPQIQNAILGRPTDMSALQPTRLPFDLQFTNVKLPETPTVGTPEAPADTPTVNPADLAALLGGR